MIDSTPIVVIAGQVGAGLLGTDAFQEVDLVGVTQPISNGAIRFAVRRMWLGLWLVRSISHVADDRDRWYSTLPRMRRRT